MIAVNLYGITSDHDRHRARVNLRLVRRPDTAWQIIVPLNQPASPFRLRGDDLSLNGAVVAHVERIDADEAVGGYFRNGGREALIVGTDRLTALPDPRHRATAPLSGDGAGAVALRCGSADGSGALGPVVLGSDSNGADLIRASRPGALHLDRTAVIRHSIDRVSTVSHQTSTAAGRRQLGSPEGRWLGNIAGVGYTGAASIPAPGPSRRRRPPEPGPRALLTAFGAGLTYASLLPSSPE
ncbi:hypothetical protein OIE75_33405 [Streptomyces sp. NBC_01723]|uniref:3-oxoacyl-[acyl-carrier-protein] synthase III C-terminal domain-containing protein n=1 Tax=Streptomyces sp. NBC_01723 TaxID=2975921 RepID=UPI002E301739|nr:3-oxoacyl-[acyl-carrier-protein] synthase III C-terminal domain-containing protein [Streptomyces sp. NBC_01723]